MKSGGHRYVDLGLRSNRMKCTVHQNFKLDYNSDSKNFQFVYRLVLIAEREKVYQEFPTPLINRLEKHFVDATTVLQPWQKDVCDQLELWLQTFLTDKYHAFTFRYNYNWITGSLSWMHLLDTVQTLRQL